MESGENWSLQDEIEMLSDREIEAEIGEILRAKELDNDVNEERLYMLKCVLHWRRFPEED